MTKKIEYKTLYFDISKIENGTVSIIFGKQTVPDELVDLFEIEFKDLTPTKKQIKDFIKKNKK